jgi:hypothetical protein
LSPSPEDTTEPQASADELSPPDPPDRSIPATQRFGTSDALAALFFGGAALLVVGGVASAVVVSKRPRPAAPAASSVVASVPVWPKEVEGLHAPIPECAEYDVEMAKCVASAPEAERAGWEAVRQARTKQFGDALTYLTTMPARDALKALCGAAKTQAEGCGGQDVGGAGRKAGVAK